jgi:exopolysaccharide biosynthesis polyprenyl glycosylphosphotransferase
MLSQRSRLVGAGVRVLDPFALVAALGLAFATAPSQGPSRVPGFSLDGYFPLLTVVLLLWIAASSALRLYDRDQPQPVAAEALGVARTLALVVLGAALAAPLWLGAGLGRLVLGLYPGWALLLLVGGRWAVRQAARLLQDGSQPRRFAVVGQGRFAEEVVDRFAAHPEWNYAFAGYVQEDFMAATDRGALCRLADLGGLLQAAVLDEVVFAVPAERLVHVQAAARLCSQQGVTVRLCVDLLRGGAARAEPGDLDGLPTLTYSTVPTAALPLAVKRAFDILVSGAVLVLMAPVLAGVALAIRRESPGPVLFRQRRIGLNGREFGLFKFRSMNQDAEAQLGALRASNEATGPVFKMRHDPRVTRVGRFIRRTSLDEFPQFWNVLRGEMSIVGPRPPIPAEVLQYQPWQRRRLSVRPGITCTWQIGGRSDVSFDRWMELDLEYIDAWSLWGDLQIFSRTIPAVLASRGAH